MQALRELILTIEMNEHKMEGRSPSAPYEFLTRDLSCPSGLELKDIQPRQVLLEIEKKPPEAKNSP